MPHHHTGEPLYVIDRPVMTQQWRQLSYLHWPYDAAQVQAHLPKGLEVDTFDGVGWVGLVPFRMVGITPGTGPRIPYFGTFPETNIRTYVTGPDGPGVWFHSLDVTRLLPVVVARLTYRLPYMWASMAIRDQGNVVTYRAVRRWPGPRGATSNVTIEIGAPIAEPTPFEHFLTARWGLYSQLRRRLTFARVEHEPWPLHRARVVDLEDDFLEAAGYEPATSEPHVMYSPGVPVRIGLPRTTRS